MSQSFKRARKEMQQEKHKGRSQPTNAKYTRGTTSPLDKFIPESKIHCTDCGQALEESKTRYITKEDKKQPYCRSCFITRMGKTVHDRD